MFEIVTVIVENGLPVDVQNLIGSPEERKDFVSGGKPLFNR